MPPDVAVRLSMVSVPTEETKHFAASVPKFQSLITALSVETPTLLTGNFSLGLVPVDFTLTLCSFCSSNGRVSVLAETIFGHFPVDVPAQVM